MSKLKMWHKKHFQHSERISYLDLFRYIPGKPKEYMVAQFESFLDQVCTLKNLVSF